MTYHMLVVLKYPWHIKDSESISQFKESHSAQNSEIIFFKSKEGLTITFKFSCSLSSKITFKFLSVSRNSEIYLNN